MTLKPCPFCGSTAKHWDELQREQCARCGALGPEYGGADAGWNTRVSPWRSLREDPPEPPTEETDHALLVRANPRDRDLSDDRYRLVVPYRDRDNGNELRWFESHLDDVLEDLIDWGYSEWMELPE